MPETAHGKGEAHNPFVKAEDYAYVKVPLKTEDPRVAAWSRVQGAEARVKKAKANLSFAEKTLGNAQAELAKLEKEAV